MNAAILTKPAKGLVLASGLLIGLSSIASAQTGTVSLGAQATRALASFYYNPPAGPALPNTTTPFDLSGGNFVYLGHGGSAMFTTSYKNPSAVYLLVNSSYTYYWYAGRRAGQVTLTFSDGTTQTTDLTIGGNVREWRIGAGDLVVGSNSDAASSNAWSGSAQGWMGGGAAVIDQLKVTVSTSGKTLTGVSVSRANDDMAVWLLFSGLTVDYTPIEWPGNSGSSASPDHRQNVGNSNALKFGGTAGANGAGAWDKDEPKTNNGKVLGFDKAKGN